MQGAGQMKLFIVTFITVILTCMWWVIFIIKDDQLFKVILVPTTIGSIVYLGFIVVGIYNDWEKV
jgi:hypothetical protein